MCNLDQKEKERWDGDRRAWVMDIKIAKVRVKMRCVNKANTIKLSIHNVHF